MSYQAQHKSVEALYRSKVVDPSRIVKHKRGGLYVLQNRPTSTYLSQSGRGVYEELSEGHRTGKTEILNNRELQSYNETKNENG